MNGLRTYHRSLWNAMQHSKKSGTGSEDVVKPTWQFFDHLRFLNDHYQARETTSNIPKRDVDDKIADTSKDEYQPYLPSLTPTACDTRLSV